MPTYWYAIASDQTIESVAELQDAVRADDAAAREFALYDRNDLESAQWRRVVLSRKDGEVGAWILKDEHGDTLDEHLQHCQQAPK